MSAEPLRIECDGATAFHMTAHGEPDAHKVTIVYTAGEFGTVHVERSDGTVARYEIEAASISIEAWPLPVEVSA